MENVFEDYHSSHSFSLTFVSQNKTLSVMVTFFLSDFFCPSYLPSFENEKGSEWWRSWLWSFPIESGAQWGRSGWLWWILLVDVTALTNQMGWEDCILGGGHGFTQKEHYPGHQWTVLEYLWFILFLDNKKIVTLLYSFLRAWLNDNRMPLCWGFSPATKWSQKLYSMPEVLFSKFPRVILVN